MEVIVNFATSAVEEFMIAKREREEYKALAKPKGSQRKFNLSCKCWLERVPEFWILMALRTIKLLLQWPIFESNLSLVFFSKQSITMSLIDATRLVCSDLYQFV
jgi:hypothetical protein